VCTQNTNYQSSDLFFFIHAKKENPLLLSFFLLDITIFVTHTMFVRVIEKVIKFTVTKLLESVLNDFFVSRHVNEY